MTAAGYEVRGTEGLVLRPGGSVRAARPADYAAVVELWSEAGLRVPPDVKAELERLHGDPALFLVATEGERVVGAVLRTFDGRRGRVNRLAVAPDRRNRGVGQRLVAELERRLRARGCRKVNLLVEPDDAQVVSFNRRLGYERDELISSRSGSWIRAEPRCRATWSPPPASRRCPPDGLDRLDFALS